MKPAFLITIDTEGDNLWSAPAPVTTRNVAFLPRFQALAERYGFLPCYLTDYDIVRSQDFLAFARPLVRRGAAEIGAHLHPWNTPPLQELTGRDAACGPYATEYPPAVIAEKIRTLTARLETAFETPIRSHRAGRWGFNGAYARILVERGYLVDCSVTPGVSWRACLGDPAGQGGPDYTACPHEPYFVDLADVCRPGGSMLLELPVTILPVSPPLVDGIRRALPPRNLLRRLLNRAWPPLTWLRPTRTNRRAMLRVLDAALRRRRSFVEFMLHSSELMPGGSPGFPDEASIEILYRDLDALLAAAARSFRPATLTGFAREAAPAAARACL